MEGSGLLNTFTDLFCLFIFDVNKRHFIFCCFADIMCAICGSHLSFIRTGNCFDVTRKDYFFQVEFMVLRRPLLVNYCDCTTRENNWFQPISNRFALSLKITL